MAGLQYVLRKHSIVRCPLEHCLYTIGMSRHTESDPYLRGFYNSFAVYYVGNTSVVRVWFLPTAKKGVGLSPHPINPSGESPTFPMDRVPGLQRYGFRRTLGIVRMV